MLKSIILIFSIAFLPLAVSAASDNLDSRISVEVPENVKIHFLKKMRGHLEALDSIIAAMADEDLALAADIASNQLGRHGGNHQQGGKQKNQKHSDAADTSHQHGKDRDNAKEHNVEATHGDGNRIQMGRYIPEPMKIMGKNMHNAAFQFSIIASEGDTQQSLKALNQLTTSCVVCHQAYRIEARK